MDLTEPMRKALKAINSVHGHSGHGYRFSTLEALRKRGLAERYTIMSLGADYVTKDDSVPQYRATAKKPHLVHDWYITQDGQAALGLAQ